MKTHTRRKFIVGNWKMHTTAREAEQLTKGVIDGIGSADHVTVILCPPFPYLALVREMLEGTRVALGGQNMYPEAEGAFTGEVSPTMLLDLGCKYVVLGHSERRHKLGESDEFIGRKVACALTAGLDVILCVGETLAEREAKQTESVLDRQLSTGLAGIPRESMAHVSIAYEPVWAIGNDDHHATPKQANGVHVAIRRKLGRICGEACARAMTIQYGGSVEPKNAAAFLGQHGIDGVLVGGASLKADAFVAIAEAAMNEIRPDMQTA